MHQVKERIAAMRKWIEAKKLPFKIMPAFDPWTNYASGLPNTLFRAWAVVYSDAASAGLYEWMDGDRPQTRKPINDCESWGERQKISLHLDHDLVFAFGTIDHSLMMAEVHVLEKQKTHSGVEILEALQRSH